MDCQAARVVIFFSLSPSLPFPLITALLKQLAYNTIHSFKVYSSVISLAYSQIGPTIISIHFGTFHHPQKEPIPFSYPPFCRHPRLLALTNHSCTFYRFPSSGHVI